MKSSIVKEIELEREKQDRLWGGKDHDAINTSNDWISILTKHVGRAVHWPWTPERFRQQMIVIAALAVAAVEWVDTQSRVDRPSV